MSQESKSLRGSLVKVILSGLGGSADDRTEDGAAGSGRLDLKAAKDLLNSFSSWAGKSKDELVQVICREIGVAVAAVLKEPLGQILQARKLKITLELLPREEATAGARERQSTKATKAKAKSKSKGRKVSPPRSKSATMGAGSD